MIRKAFLVAVMCLVTLPAWAYTVTVYTFHSVAGVDYARNAPNMRVKFCEVATGGCSYGISDPTGRATISATRAGYYYAYIYDTNGKWGSTETPDPNQYYVWPIFSEQIVRLSAFPRPLVPALVSPCNGCGVPPGDFNLSWTSGLDWERTAPNWPATYEIWTSATPPGWPQGPEGLGVADAPCNPDAQGRCRWYVDFLDAPVGTRYTWRIVVKLNFGGGVVYKTSGPKWTLYQQ